MEQLLQDIRFGARLLWKDRPFTLTTVLTLALCLGINAAIFGVVYSVLLKPLPYPESDRIVLMYNTYPNAGVVHAGTGVPDYYDRLREVDVFEEQALYDERGLTIGGAESAERVTAMEVTPSMFRLLRASPFRGRIFSEQDAEIGNQHKVILSYALWQRLFAGGDAAVGRDLRIGGVPYAIVGVMPARFVLVNPDVALWTPLAFTPQQKSDESRHSNN